MALVIVFIAGILVLSGNNRVSSSLQFGSYDLAHDLSRLLTRPAVNEGVVIIYMDEASHRDLDQPFNAPWSRNLHAKLLDKLTQDHAKAVVFDIVFSDSGPTPSEDVALAAAIKRNGNVVLAADISESQPVSTGTYSSYQRTVFRPYRPFYDAAAKVGFGQLRPDRDFMVREHEHADLDGGLSSLTWVTAELLKLPNVAPESRTMERWVNYYGTPGRIPSISYSMALNVPRDYFRDKIVFIGARSGPGFTGERRDEFRNPYTTWFHEPVFMPAVEIHATILLNLIRGDWLRRPSPAIEWIILILSALFLGFHVVRLRPAKAAWHVFLFVMALLFAVALCLRGFGVWLPWLIIPVIQAPAGILSNFVLQSMEWLAHRRAFEQARVKAENRIREQAALLDKAQDAIIVQDLDGNVTYWNASSKKLYGWSFEEIGGQNALSLISAGTGFDYDTAVQYALSHGEWSNRIEQSTKIGDKIMVETRWTLIRDDEGRAKSILMINTDVTEKSRLEAQLQRAQRVESIGTLASGIAHDLNNVFSPILISSQLLRGKEQDQGKISRLETIELAAKKGAELVKQVLSFVRGCEGQIVAVQIKHVIREVAHIASQTFPAGISIKLDLAPDLPPVAGDVTKLNQVLLNLCVNARDAMPSGGNISISAREIAVSEKNATNLAAGSYVKVEVADTGSGIAPELIDKIFDPFFTTKDTKNNSGLGLSTVLGIIKSLHGGIEVDSQPGRGATFRIYLPATISQAPAPEPPPSSGGEFIGSGQGILIVSKDPLLRGIIDLVLTKHNYLVYQAESNALAMDVINKEKTRIDLVIADDGPNSKELFSAVSQTRTANPEVRFAVIGFEACEDSASVCGLVQPLTLRTILAGVQHILQKQSPSLLRSSVYKQ